MTDTGLIELLRTLGVQNLTVRGNNVHGCCPNHAERRPSWGISLQEPHKHGCFSCGFGGTLRTLLQRHYNWTEVQINNVLGSVSSSTEGFDPSAFELVSRYPRQHAQLPEKSVLYPYTRTVRANEYLRSRRIEKAVRTEAQLLYDHNDDRLLFPWFKDDVFLGATGRTLQSDPSIPKTIPYFGLKKGSFFYVPARSLDHDLPLVLVEGEFDALRVFQCGYRNAAALSFGRMSSSQRDVIITGGFPYVVCFFDNDDTGRKLTLSVADSLQGYTAIRAVDFSILKISPDKKTDPGELRDEECRTLIEDALSKKAQFFPIKGRNSFSLV